MTATPPPLPPAGWYPDPSGAPRQRYFDGRLWTEHYAPLGQPLASPPVPQKRSSNSKVILGVAGVLVALVAIGSAFGGEDKKTSTTATSASRTASVADAPSTVVPSTPKAAPAGSAVRDGKFEFQVLDITRAKTVSDPTGNPYLTTTAQGEFIVITLAVRNIGDEPRSYFGSNQKFIDASGREFAPSSSADMWMNTTDPMGDINPGNSIQVKVAFDVPPGTPTEGAVLELHDSMLSGGVQVQLGAPSAGGG